MPLWIHRIVRFLPLLAYAAGLAYMLTAALSPGPSLTVAIFSAPITLGIPLAAIVIGHRPRQRRTYLLGMIGGIVGVCAVAALIMFVACAWISFARIESGASDVAMGEYIMAFVLFCRTGLDTIGPLAWGSIVTALWMAVCALTAAPENKE